MGSLSFRQLCSLLFVSFVALLLASYLSAWTGPTASPPGGNVSAPINVGTASQIKDGVIGVDGLAVFGTTYIQTKLGINDDTPVVALDVAGTARLGNGGEVCQAVTEGAQRYNSTSKQMEFCDGSEWSLMGSAGETVVLPATSRVSLVYGSFPNNSSPSWTTLNLSSYVPVGTTAVLLTYYCNQTQLMVSESGSALTTANNPSGGDGASPRSQGQACAARNNSIDYNSGWVSVSSDRTIRYAFAGLDGQSGTGQIRLDGYVTAE